MQRISPRDLEALSALQQAYLACFQSDNVKTAGELITAIGKAAYQALNGNTYLANRLATAMTGDIPLPVRDAAAKVLGTPYVHVAFHSPDETGTAGPALVFEDVNDAFSWVEENDGSTHQVEFIPAPVTLPHNLDLDMLAADIAKAVADYDYDKQGFDVDQNAMREALPAFVAATLAAQARQDAARGE
jgi:hypothetical protein